MGDFVNNAIPALPRRPAKTADAAQNAVFSPVRIARTKRAVFKAARFVTLKLNRPNYLQNLSAADY